MSLEDKYLDLTDDQIDNLLLGVNLNGQNNVIPINIDEAKQFCVSCKNNKIYYRMSEFL